MLLVGAVAALVAAAGTLREVASCAAFSILVYYGVANFAAFRMDEKAKLYADFVPLFGLVACTVLAFSLTPSMVAVGLTILAAGFAVRHVMRRSLRARDHAPR